ncbi:Vesicle transport through interaction with t-SNAREs-like protein 1B [Zootermopsis nevadensis]|uniref:Vesicle transport through interaction with t-SNAREs-like protein 1B n=2 Tax=Zootermopsis nevadensis TaxID=136037 RepID=A0A067R662_ZOONE|nr:Vesicle transport through interaction with t-SNAREs-like protein 1B [Zootermopsis nevadensis]
MSGFIWEDETRHAVLEGHATLERTAESLARSQRTAVETERIAEEVVSELGAQRETLLHSKRRLTDTDHELSQTRVLLRKMTLHVLTNKIILIFIIVLEICILAGVCYIKFSH